MTTDDRLGVWLARHGWWTMMGVAWVSGYVLNTLTMVLFLSPWWLHILSAMIIFGWFDIRRNQGLRLLQQRDREEGDDE